MGSSNLLQGDESGRTLWGDLSKLLGRLSQNTLVRQISQGMMNQQMQEAAGNIAMGQYLGLIPYPSSAIDPGQFEVIGPKLPDAPVIPPTPAEQRPLGGQSSQVAATPPNTSQPQRVEEGVSPESLAQLLGQSAEMYAQPELDEAQPLQEMIGNSNVLDPAIASYLSSITGQALNPFVPTLPSMGFGGALGLSPEIGAQMMQEGIQIASMRDQRAKEIASERERQQLAGLRERQMQIGESEEVRAKKRFEADMKKFDFDFARAEDDLARRDMLEEKLGTSMDYFGVMPKELQTLWLLSQDKRLSEAQAKQLAEEHNRKMEEINARAVEKSPTLAESIYRDIMAEPGNEGMNLSEAKTEQLWREKQINKVATVNTVADMLKNMMMQDEWKKLSAKNKQKYLQALIDDHGIDAEMFKLKIKGLFPAFDKDFPMIKFAEPESLSPWQKKKKEAGVGVTSPPAQSLPEMSLEEFMRSIGA